MTAAHAAPNDTTAPTRNVAPNEPLRVGRTKRRRQWYWFRVTREGRIFLLLTVLVALAAVNTGNNLLFLMLGLMLSFLVLSGIMSELVLRKIRVERRVPSRMFAGTPAIIEIVVRNGKRATSSYSLEVEDRIEGEDPVRHCYFLRVGPGSEQVATYRRTPMRRGVMRFRELRLTTRFPFGLVEKWIRVEDLDESLVYPALLPSGATEAKVTGAESERGRTTPGIGSEVAGVRLYRDGDDPRNIHWRRTAALGELVVKEREQDEPGQLKLHIANVRPRGVDAEAWNAALELEISRAASLCASSMKRGMSVEVSAESAPQAMTARGKPEPVWRYLALLETVDADEGRR